MSNTLRILLALVFFMGSCSAYANVCAQKNNEITGLVGVDGIDGKLYAQVSSDSNECGCSVYRFSPQNADTDKVLSVLLTARLADLKLRVDILDEVDCDTAFRVYIQY